MDASTHEPDEPQAGREVRPDDAGVPNDPPGPGVPPDTGSVLPPDAPAHPTAEQPEGTAGVDGADPDRGGEADADDEAQDEPD